MAGKQITAQCDTLTYFQLLLLLFQFSLELLDMPGRIEARDSLRITRSVSYRSSRNHGSSNNSHPIWV
jgi:hypothetical protein